MCFQISWEEVSVAEARLGWGWAESNWEGAKCWVRKSLPTMQRSSRALENFSRQPFLSTDKLAHHLLCPLQAPHSSRRHPFIVHRKSIQLSSLKVLSVPPLLSIFIPWLFLFRCTLHEIWDSPHSEGSDLHPSYRVSFTELTVQGSDTLMSLHPVLPLCPDLPAILVRVLQRTQ